MSGSRNVLLMVSIIALGCQPSEDPDTMCPTWYADVDQDGFGDPDVPIEVCSDAQTTEGLVRNNTDCDDLAPDINPDGEEQCDLSGFDEDCDGWANDLDPDFQGGVDTWADADGDGQGDPGSALILLCDVPAGRAANALDCNDADAATYLGAADLESTDTCMTDVDGDGYGSAVPASGATAGTDCDDNAPDSYPFAKEFLDDAVDQDCSGQDDWFVFDDFESGGPNPYIVPTLNNTRISDEYSHSGDYSIRIPAFTNLVFKEIGTPFDEVTGEGCANIRWSFWVKRGPNAPGTDATLSLQGWDGTGYDNISVVQGNGLVDDEFEFFSGSIGTDRAYRDALRVRFRASDMGEGEAFYVDDIYFACTGVDADGDGVGENEDCIDTDPRHWSDCETCIDKDDDGFGTDCDLGNDCDDADAARNPDQIDNTVDGIDQNCDAMDGPAVRDDFEDGVVDPDVWTSMTGNYTYQNIWVADGDFALRMTGGTEGEIIQLNTLPCDEVGWAAQIMGRRPYYNDSLSLNWFDGQEWRTAWTKAGTYTTDSRFEWERGIIEDPLSLWVGFKARLTAAGYTTTNYDYYSWYVDNFAVACNPADLDGDGLWGGLQDCDDSSRAHWSDCGKCQDADGDDFGVDCDLGDDCDDKDASINPLAYDEVGDGNDVDCNGFDGPGLFDDFEDGEMDATVWSIQSGNTYYVTNYKYDGDYSLRQSYNDAVAESHFMNVEPCESVEWKLQGRDGTDGLDNSDYWNVEWWDGTNWNSAYKYPGDSSSYNNSFVEFQGYIAGPGVIHDRFRIRVRSESNSTFDYFYLDDIDVTCGPPNNDGDRYVQGEDCDDNDPNHWSDCGLCVDNDGDDYGFDCDLGEDCDDTDPDVNPNGTEIVNDGIDQDCDGFDTDLVIRDDFEAGSLDAAIWPTTSGSTLMSTSYSSSGSYSVQMGGQSEMETTTMDTSASCDMLTWKVKYYRGDSYNALDLIDHFRLYYIDDNGDEVEVFEMRGVYGYDYDNDLDFVERFGMIDASDALHSDFGMKLYVDSNSSGTFDRIYVDDFIVGCTQDDDDDGFAAAVDCDDSDPQSWDNCRDCADLDGDGFGSGCDIDNDCDDTDTAINPAATEVEGDGVDQNCDGFDSATVFHDKFDSGDIDSNVWNGTSGDVAVTMSYPYSVQNSLNLWGGGRATTNTLDTSACNELGIRFKAKRNRFFYTSQYLRMYIEDTAGTLVQTWTMAGGSVFDRNFIDFSGTIDSTSQPDAFHADAVLELYQNTYVSSYPYYDVHIDDFSFGCEPTF